MLHSVAARCGIGLHASVRRTFIEPKQCLGLVCQEGYSFRPGEVLAVVPFWCCPSHLVALASPWGREITRAVDSYEVTDGEVKVAFPRESATAAVFTALAMSAGSPIQTYLQYIEQGMANDRPVSLAQSTDSFARLSGKLESIERLTKQIADALRLDVSGVGLTVEASRLETAMRMCQSRCMDVPNSDDVFGGPALVPIADLVNHGDCEPNVAVALTTADTMRAMVKRGRSPGDRCVDVRSVSSHCPFFCVMVAAQDVHGGTELTYQYVDPQAEPQLFNDDLFWASRFRFCR